MKPPRVRKHSGGMTDCLGADVDQCAVVGCNAQRVKREWCNKHYLRWWKHGDPAHAPQTFTRCQIDGCDSRPRSTTASMCEMHYYRSRRHGDPGMVTDRRKGDAGYRAAHGRITRARGRASERQCIDCHARAHHWSYRHDDPDELTSPNGQPYSLDPEHYDPRCVPCHATFDGTGAGRE